MSSLFSRLAEPYLRWRHTHGFGVHSPYAYKLVTTVLNPRGVTYYGYAAVEKAGREYSKPEVMRRDIKDGYLLLRLCAFLNTRDVYLDVSVPYTLEDAAAAVYRDALYPEDPRDADLIVAYLKSSGEAMEGAIRYHIPLMACHDDVDHATLEACFKANGCGVWLEGRRWSIIIPRDQMAPVHYLVL